MIFRAHTFTSSLSILISDIISSCPNETYHLFFYPVQSELAELEAEHALLKKEAASSATPSLRASRTSRSIETVLPTPPPPTRRYDGKVSDHSKKAYGVGAPG